MGRDDRARSAELTIGDLIDRLIVENVRLWHLQDDMTSNDDTIAGAAARETTRTNARRVALRGEITRRLEGGNADDRRTYGAPRRAR